MDHSPDAIERAIIGLLQEDGRMSSAEIARRIGSVSERVVRHRIARLRDEGVLHVTAVVDAKAVGFPIQADLWVEVEPALVGGVAQAAARIPHVSYVAYSTGDRDLSMQLFARDTQEVHHLVIEVVGRLPGVRHVRAVIVPRVIKDVYDWQPPIDPDDEGERSHPWTDR